ncbi:tail fiber protein [Synechococcus phage S-SM2]|uniref:Phage tail fiber-like protein n=1 Tax=Synechococcus phage S-SM2 TaxID=444860 RepID=E3SJ01_9CAUD|nr:tail fiber protein [Synechococcus phage S-SM2]ADO97449.1 phage tail fiber-like protein [Synechococcus phage S-SM2]
MSGDLGQFFSLIGKAKKEKEDEFRSLVGEVDIDSMFSQVKESITEDKKKKKKEEKQIQALESWLFTETQLQEKTKEVEKSPVIGVDETEYEKWIEDECDEEEEVTSEVAEETEEEEVEDTVDHALKILETIKSKEEVRENLEDPEILKIRRELEYLKNLVNAQGGGGEVRLEFLDDVDRDTAKVDGKFLKYQSSTGKWVGADASGGGGDSEEASKLVLDARNQNVGYAITIGTPVYQTGYNSGQNRINIEGARASDPSTMPAKGVTITDLANNTNGQILVYGELEGVDTSAFDVADELFVGPNGGLTNTRPTDPGHLVQKIAVVLKKSASNGAILVYGAGRTNDVPNSISVAGIITASSFDGDLTGNADTATYASSAGIATFATTAGVSTNAQGLTGTPDITVNNIVGVAATFTGDVSIAGTLTYEDVTNIDSVGIVTARSGVFFGSPTVSAIITNSATTTTESQTSIDSFSASTYRSAKYQVQITRGSEYQVTEISIVHDGSDSYGTEYATLKTGETLSTFSTDISGGNVRLLATPSSSTSTVFKFTKTAIVV